jgi:lysyl-tRNA synthetase class 2
VLRSEVLEQLRAFFKAQDFLEVETPLLVERPSTETYLEFFETQLEMAEGTKRRGFLTTSPEYAMKKLLAAGLPRIYQMCKSFRNGEGMSSRHNPEFLILEWYRTQADYQDIMTDCEEMWDWLLTNLRSNPLLKDRISGQPGKYKLAFQGKTYDCARPWQRLSVAEAFAKFADIDTETLLDEVLLIKAAAQKGYQVTDQTTWEEAYNQIFLNEVESQINQADRPIFLYDYPVSQAALSRRKTSDRRFAERFELYLAGLELGNAFSELTDAAEQEQRLRADLKFRAKIGKRQYELDEDFITALQTGMPPTGGIAVGVDRVIQILADAASIHETLFFPVFDVFELP